MGQGNNMGRGSHYPPSIGNYSLQTTAAIAKELLDTGTSPTAEALVKSGAKTVSIQNTNRPKQQLLFMAEVLGFQVQYTDFPKGTNKNEYLSLVSLSTSPPQVSHGAGQTIDESHDIASLTALKALADCIDKIIEKNGKRDIDNRLASGDGPHMTDAGDKMANSLDLGNNAIKTETQ